jgi:hypothetical protein
MWFKKSPPPPVERIEKNRNYTTTARTGVYTEIMQRLRSEHWELSPEEEASYAQRAAQRAAMREALAEQERIKREIAEVATLAQRLRDQDEIALTCIWCGQICDSQAGLEAHEETCQ